MNFSWMKTEVSIESGWVSEMTSGFDVGISRKKCWGINIQVRYSATGGMYVTASKDGGIRIWDGVSGSCVRAIELAHGSSEATSAHFTKDQR